MANTSVVRGLFPLRPYRRVTYYTANTGVNMFLYQPVALNNSGQIAIISHHSGNAILGSVVGFLGTNGEHLVRDDPYLKSGNDALVAVTDHPDQEYILEEDTGGSALAETNIGNLADFTLLGTTGNTVTGISNAVLDRSGVQTDSGQFRLVGLHRQADSVNEYGNYAKWVVKIREYQFGSARPMAGI